MPSSSSCARHCLPTSRICFDGGHDQPCGMLVSRSRPLRRSRLPWRCRLLLRALDRDLDDFEAFEAFEAFAGDAASLSDGVARSPSDAVPASQAALVTTEARNVA